MFEPPTNREVTISCNSLRLPCINTFTVQIPIRVIRILLAGMAFEPMVLQEG